MTVALARGKDTFKPVGLELPISMVDLESLKEGIERLER
jgi:hypothetical protein